MTLSRPAGEFQGDRAGGPVPYWSDDRVALHVGDCLDVMRQMPDASVDSVVTDPPYGLEFMGKSWDAPWEEGGINADAGFKGGGIGATKAAPTFTGSTNPNCLNCGGKQRGRRDGTAIVAVCTCGTPRFPNVRAVEMRAFQAWCEQWAAECLRVLKPGAFMLAFGGARTWHRLACAVEDAGFEIRDSVADLTGCAGPALLWIYGSGFPKARTALKPAWEPIVVGRKPPTGSVAANVLEHGTGALNIDACRLPAGQDYRDKCASVVGLASNRNGDAYGEWTGERADSAHDAGRWPPNVLLGPDAADEMDRQSGTRRSAYPGSPERAAAYAGSSVSSAGATYLPDKDAGLSYSDSGGASRYFPVFRYQAKAPASERPRGDDGSGHPTVKPVPLMTWLARLATPPGGTVLDMFAGSGTTGEACIIEGFHCVLIEKDPASARLIRTRLRKDIQPVMFGAAS